MRIHKFTYFYTQGVANMAKIQSKKMPFVGRKDALAELKVLDESTGASLVVIRGRRRIGKSRLVAEYAQHAQDKTFIKFSGLAPEKEITAKHQRENFANQFQEQFHCHLPSSDDWSHLFSALADQIKTKRCAALDRTTNPLSKKNIQIFNW